MLSGWRKQLAQADQAAIAVRIVPTVLWRHLGEKLHECWPAMIISLGMVVVRRLAMIPTSSDADSDSSLSTHLLKTGLGYHAFHELIEERNRKCGITMIGAINHSL